MRKKKLKKFPRMGLEPSITGFERQYAITSTVQAIDTRSPHQRTIYVHKDNSTAIFIKLWLEVALGTRWLFYPLGYTFIMH